MLLNRRLHRDLGILTARIGIGVIMFAHGWQKLVDWTVGGTAQAMGAGGVPLPTLSAYFTTFAELFVGVALIVGLLVPLAALVTAFIMAGAFVFVQGANGMYMENDGYGFVLAIGVAALMLAGTGSGRFGLDHVIAPRLSSRFTKNRLEPVA